MAKINAKKKGNRGELELVKILCERFGEGKFKRTPSSGGFVGGANRAFSGNLTEAQKQAFASDIIAPENFKFSIEHKFYKNPFTIFDLENKSSDINNWFEQVSGDAAFAGKEPLLIVKYNGKKRIVFSRELVDIDYILETKGWYCYWLDDLIKIENSFWFKE